jgi:hypothetical protein
MTASNKISRRQVLTIAAARPGHRSPAPLPSSGHRRPRTRRRCRRRRRSIRIRPKVTNAAITARYSKRPRLARPSTAPFPRRASASSMPRNRHSFRRRPDAVVAGKKVQEKPDADFCERVGRNTNLPAAKAIARCRPLFYGCGCRS